jgi:carboxymethylenebutenolidase
MFYAAARRRILANVTEMQRYIGEEIAVDHVDGLLSRREALRRLALLGLSATAASALIAACGAGGKKESSGSTTGTGAVTSAPPGTGSTTGTGAVTSGPPGMERALPTQLVTWTGPNGELQGAWAQAADARGGVLVIHENKGLNDWVRSVAGRFAGVGYSALAIDLLSEEGGTAKFTDPAEATAALSKVAPDRFVANLKSGVGELQRRVPGKKVAAVGFCFGGGMVWQLLGSGEPQLAAAVPFYGPLRDNPDFAGSKAAVLAIYGALDTRVTSSKDAAVAALNRAGLVNEVYVAPDADHAFFNDTGQRYNPAAAAEAWRKVLDWLGRYVG